MNTLATFRIDPATKEAAAAKAKSDGTTLTSVIVSFLKMYGEGRVELAARPSGAAANRDDVAAHVGFLAAAGLPAGAVSAAAALADTKGNAKFVGGRGGLRAAVAAAVAAGRGSPLWDEDGAPGLPAYAKPLYSARLALELGGSEDEARAVLAGKRGRTNADADAAAALFKPSAAGFPTVRGRLAGAAKSYRAVLKDPFASAMAFPWKTDASYDAWVMDGVRISRAGERAFSFDGERFRKDEGRYNLGILRLLDAKDAWARAAALGAKDAIDPEAFAAALLRRESKGYLGLAVVFCRAVGAEAAGKAAEAAARRAGFLTPRERRDVVSGKVTSHFA